MQWWREDDVKRTQTVTFRSTRVTAPLAGRAVYPGTVETLKAYVPGASPEKTIERSDEHSVTFTVTHQTVPYASPVSRKMIESARGAVDRANATWTVRFALSIVTGDGGTDDDTT